MAQFAAERTPLLRSAFGRLLTLSGLAGVISLGGLVSLSRSLSIRVTAGSRLIAGTVAVSA